MFGWQDEAVTLTLTFLLVIFFLLFSFQEGSNNGTVPPTKTDLYNPAVIDPREYAPQVVELQDTVSSYDSKGSSSSREEAEPPASWSGVTGVDKGSIHWNQNTIEVEEDKKSRWLQKLQTLQKKFRPPQ